jgi:maltooligosyltrehalose trehalohydrolase
MRHALGDSLVPVLGASPQNDGTWFRTWATAGRQVAVVIEGKSPMTTAYRLAPRGDGVFETFVPGVRPGARYRYLLDGNGPYPDPASRYQPEGVHGPSEVIDPSAFRWTDHAWTGLPAAELVAYELHVGTITPAGTFAGAAARLPDLTTLGVRAVELMPVADFAGARNWGYDGVALFAPARCYGRPEDLRRFVDAAHALGIAVILDVVYNHLGPDGAYMGRFSPDYFRASVPTPWGEAVNLQHRVVREFLIGNALHWLREYHMDGLRLDATHALVDEGPVHFLGELSARVRETEGARTAILIAEDDRNLARIATPAGQGGWGFDAIWADDFHHQMRRHLAGDDEGYFRAFSGSAEDIAATIRQGWFYCGQPVPHTGSTRGTDPGGLAPHQLVICLQNHDQVGNRAMGERLHHQIDLPAYRAATVLLLCAPQMPLLFMGQEWAASSPFQFFTDHHAVLGALVTEGRRREFGHFRAFADPSARARIPDPQADATFEGSRLRWEERDQEPHASTLRLYQALLALRRHEPALRATRREDFDVAAVGASTLLLHRRAPDGGGLLIVVHLRGAAEVPLDHGDVRRDAQATGEVVLSTEEPRFAFDAVPPAVDWSASPPRVRFHRPGGLVVRMPSGAHP